MKVKESSEGKWSENPTWKRPLPNAQGHSTTQEQGHDQPTRAHGLLWNHSWSCHHHRTAKSCDFCVYDQKRVPKGSAHSTAWRVFFNRGSIGIWGRTVLTTKSCFAHCGTFSVPIICPLNASGTSQSQWHSKTTMNTSKHYLAKYSGDIWHPVEN